MYAFIFYPHFLSMLTLLLVSGEFVACSSILGGINCYPVVVTEGEAGGAGGEEG